MLFKPHFFPLTYYATVKIFQNEFVNRIIELLNVLSLVYDQWNTMKYLLGMRLDFCQIGIWYSTGIYIGGIDEQAFCCVGTAGKSVHKRFFPGDDIIRFL